MAAEDDILKTLVRIEKILGQGSVASGLGRAPPRVAGGRNDTTQDRTTNRDNGNQKKSYRATTASMNGLNDATNNLNRSFWGLNKTIINTRGNFVEMNRSMRAAARNAPTANVTSGQQTLPAGADATGGARTLMQKILGAVGFGPRGSLGPRGPRPGSGQVVPPGGGAGPAANEAADAIRGLAGRSVTAGFVLVQFAKHLLAVVPDLIEDILMLQSAGINASSALGGMYMDAALAGMSLKDYTKVVQDASVVAARSGSMEEFGKTLKVTQKQLGSLGFFGPEAVRLAGAMQTSAVSLGVPFDQLTKVTQAQTDVFAELRKSSLMTAEQLQALSVEMGKNQEVQSQLIGMAPSERGARLIELTQIRTLGYRMGATAEASEALGKALIDQRKATVVEQFNAGGAIRQGGAALGISASDSDEMAQLNALGGRASAAQAKRLTQLSSNFETALQGALNSSDMTTRFVADEINKQMKGAGVDTLNKAAANASQANQSKDATPTVGADGKTNAVNADFAKAVPEFAQGAANLYRFAQGLDKNPIINAVLGAFGSAAFTLGLGAVIGRVLGGTLGGGAAAGGGGLISRITGGLMGAPRAILDAFKGVFNFFTPSNLGPLVRNGFTALRTVVIDAFKWISSPFRIGPGTGIIADLKAATTFVTDGLKFGIGKLGDAAIFVKDGFGNIITKLGDGAAFLKNGLGNWVTKITDAGGLFKVMGDWFRGLGPRIFGAIGEGVRGITEVGGLFKIIGRAFSFAKFIPVIGNILALGWDAISEMITSNVAAAFSADGGGIVDRIGNVIFAAINGLMGSVGFLMDKLVGLFTNDGFHFENALNIFGVFMKAGFMGLLAKIAGVFGDNKVSRYFTESADASFAVMDKLLADRNATVSSLGEKANVEIDKKTKVTAVQADKQKATADVSAAAAEKQTATIKATAAVATNAAAILSTTQGVTAGLVADAAKIATPGPTTPTIVTQPAVNNPNTTPAAVPAAPATPPVPAAPLPVDPVVAQLLAMTEILRSIATAEQLQAAGLSDLARGINRPAFSDNQDLLRYMTKAA